LKCNKRATLVFNESRVNRDESLFESHDWSDFYCGAEENLPPNAPTPRGHSVQINCFVDVDHAGNKITICLHTGILIFINRSLIIWFSKDQNTIETSTFGLEFIAMHIAVELLESL
jgi:hypothetical protein